MKRGPDGIWRTVGGIEVKEYQPTEKEVIHKLFICHPTMPLYDIVERECRIVVTGKITWAEPLMPLRGAARRQKRFMLGAFAFYTRQQAERKKLIMLAQAAKAGTRQWRLSSDARLQLEHFKATGEVK